MNFDYCRIGSISATPTPVTLRELAINIATDWMPGTPNTLSRGFVDLLTNVLEPKSIKSRSLLIVKSDVSKFEKQWKQVTSWILGVAFCRKVVELEGYPWWAPVSAFTSSNPRWAPSATNWYPALPLLHCRINKPNPSASNLMPDYVLARQHPIKGYEIGFAESKGTNKYIEKMTTVRIDWANQSKNAKFYYRRRFISPAQQMVVATRVNPNALRVSTRRIYVRAWNSKNIDNQTPIEPILEIMFMHYFGVCTRIGMEANAKLLALSSYSRSHLFQESQKDISHILDSSRNKLNKMANEEIKTGKIQGLNNAPIFFTSLRSEFIIGNKKIRIGLSEPAMEIVRNLQEGTDIICSNDFIKLFQKGIKSLITLSKESPDVILRNDGVISDTIHYD